MEERVAPCSLMLKVTASRSSFNPHAFMFPEAKCPPLLLAPLSYTS